MLVKRFFSLFVSWPIHIKTPAGTTTTIAVCPRCGTIGKSGKPSCCGRGGAWFKNCGGAGNAELDHSWFEGIQACKARSQSKTAFGQQLNADQQKDIERFIGSYPGDGMTNYKAAIAATKRFAFTSVNPSTPMSETTSILKSTYTPDNTTPAQTLTTNHSTNALMPSSTHTSASTSTATQGYTNLSKITVHINLLFVVVFLVCLSFWSVHIPYIHVVWWFEHIK